MQEKTSIVAFSKSLQLGGAKTLNLYSSRRLFDGLITDFGANYPLSALQKASDLVNDPNFKNGMIKIQAGLENTLTRLEKAAVAIFLKDKHNDEEEKSDGENQDVELSYAERILNEANEEAKKRRVIESKYRSTEHVLSTSNLCKRLFSLCKILMSDRRKSMHPQSNSK